MSAPALHLDGLVLRAPGGAPLLGPLSLTVAPGEVLALAGPSGAGKTTLLRALLGLLPAGFHAEGRGTLGPHALPALGPAQLAPHRGRPLGYLPQDAAASFVPGEPVGDAAAALARRWGLPPGAILRAWADAGFPPALAARPAAHLSGGEAQRAALALALLPGPGLLLADEPTAALDAPAAAAVLGALRRLARDTGLAVLLVTHDPRALSAADRVLRPWGTPPPPAPPAPAPAAAAAAQAALEAHTLRVPGRLGPLHLRLDAGRHLGLLGRSGSGKSTLLRALLLLEPTARGAVAWFGVHPGALAPAALRAARAAVQPVWQDALATLDPRLPVGASLAAVAAAHGRPAGPAALAAHVAPLGLGPTHLARRPGALSGGERRRLLLARALLPGPRVLLCDEPTAHLDPVAAAAVRGALDAAQHAHGLTVLTITHDPAELAGRATELLVLDAGLAVECGPWASVCAAPAHPVTQALLGAAGLFSPPDPPPWHAAVPPSVRP